MKKLLMIIISLLLTSNAFSHELNVVCNNIMPEEIIFDGGAILTDTFRLSEKLDYFDDAQSNYGLVQSTLIINANGNITQKLSVASQFYAGSYCGPTKIVADNKVFGGEADYKITIEIEDTCNAENTSTYTLERAGKTAIVKSFTSCTYDRK